MGYPSSVDLTKITVLTLLGDNKGWQLGAPGAALTITYSFLKNPPTGNMDSISGFEVFNAAQQQSVKLIFNLLQAQTGLTLLEDDSGQGQIRFGISQQFNTRGYSYSPDQFKNDQRAGDVWIDKETAEHMQSGSEGYYVLLHEIAHAFGLQHPLATLKFAGEKVVLNKLSSLSNTIMLEVNSTDLSGSWPTWFGNFDIQAFRYLYGTKAYATGNDRYILSDKMNRMTILDDGGNDTIDASSLSASVLIDLREGGLSSVGTTQSGVAEFQNISISFESQIENVIDSINDDVIIGNSLNNVMSYVGGNDMFDGQSGIDLIQLSYNLRDFKLIKQATTGYWNLEGQNNVFGAIELRNIERAIFKDSALALDTAESGHAATTAKILGAVFGKEALLNKSYVGIGLSFLDSGWTYDNLAGLALDAAGAKTNDQIVSLLWTNVIGSKPTANDKVPFIAMLENGMSPGALAHLAADSSFNITNINLVGLTQTGIEYIPVS